MMRTFVAPEIPKEFPDSFLESTVSLRERYPGFRRTKEENLHITLAFMGQLRYTPLQRITFSSDTLSPCLPPPLLLRYVKELS
jgi:2'-5' RNA ligase